jgi:hypothetical protein
MIINKMQNFMLISDFTSVEIIEKKCTWKKLLAENFSKLWIEKSASSKFLHFTSTAYNLVWIYYNKKYNKDRIYSDPE